MIAPAAGSARRSPDLLEAILSATRHAVAVSEERRSRQALEKLGDQRTPRASDFRTRLANQDRMSVIAECKRRSPSRGVLRSEYVPTEIAKGYQAAGAAAISVLTEPAFFDGQLEHLRQVREAVEIPVLRKDFVLTEYQVIEARSVGADAVLLIVAALDDHELPSLLRSVQALGLAALVEVHNDVELTRALDAGADIIGVNNRNLRTLEVDLDASFALVAQIPDSVVAVAESGIRSGTDLTALRNVGYDACLIGESLMTCDHPGRSLQTMIDQSGPAPRPRREKP